TVNELLSSVTTPKASVPAFKSSTATTATLSFGLWASTCGMRSALAAGFAALGALTLVLMRKDVSRLFRHVGPPAQARGRLLCRPSTSSADFKTWMAGTSPAMTIDPAGRAITVVGRYWRRRVNPIWPPAPAGSRPGGRG